MKIKQEYLSRATGCLHDFPTQQKFYILEVLMYVNFRKHLILKDLRLQKLVLKKKNLKLKMLLEINLADKFFFLFYH